LDHIGIDVHKKESQICMLPEGGEVVESRVSTTPERFADVLGDRPPARILVQHRERDRQATSHRPALGWAGAVRRNPMVTNARSRARATANHVALGPDGTATASRWSIE
jgi:hypothetical protein